MKRDTVLRDDEKESSGRGACSTQSEEFVTGAARGDFPPGRRSEDEGVDREGAEGDRQEGSGGEVEEEAGRAIVTHGGKRAIKR